MSLAIDLTANHAEIFKAEKRASAILRSLKGVVPASLYGDLQAQHCIIASECNKLGVNLAGLRMIGELEQRPAPVTVETLELAQCMPMMMTFAGEEKARACSQARLVPVFPDHEIKDQSEAFARELELIGDDTLKEGMV